MSLALTALSLASPLSPIPRGFTLVIGQSRIRTLALRSRFVASLSRVYVRRMFGMAGLTLRLTVPACLPFGLPLRLPFGLQLHMQKCDQSKNYL